MHPPSPMPSKNWWKDRAIISGFIVSGLCDAPSDIPMITECTTIPNSRTCTAGRSIRMNVVRIYKKRRKKKEVCRGLSLLKLKPPALAIGSVRMEPRTSRLNVFTTDVLVILCAAGLPSPTGWRHGHEALLHDHGHASRAPARSCRSSSRWCPP